MLLLLKRLLKGVVVVGRLLGGVVVVEKVGCCMEQLEIERCLLSLGL